MSFCSGRTLRAVEAFWKNSVDCSGSLTKLEVNLYRLKNAEMGHDELEEDELLGLYQEVASSNGSLEELEIKFGSNGPTASLPELWDLLMSCSDFLSLELLCFDVTADEELVFPTEVPPFHPKTLRFRL